MHADSTLHRPSDRIGEPALARCHELTTRQSNHLHAAARRLDSARRYEFFLACYAAMRALDDMVDCEFLGSPREERDAMRADMLCRLDRWREQTTEASQGRYRAREGDLEPLVFEALDEYLSRSDLGTTPFFRLAGSLRRDLEELPLRDEKDLLEYCEGAAVAPGAIFLYLLGAEEDPEGAFHLPGAAILDQARELAHFCYLTHIARDLAEDAAKDAQLVTIPDSWLREHGFDRRGFRRAASTQDPSVRPLARRLLEQAERAGEAAERRLAPFRTDLPVAHREILDYLFGLYREAHDQVARRWI